MDRSWTSFHLGGLAQSALARIPRRSNGAGRSVVLCYHSVHATKSFSSVSPELFRKHLEWLKENCDVVPFAGILDHVGSEASRPTVALTFDDGYRDNHGIALPLLLEYELPATVFVTSGLIDRDPAVLAHVARGLGTSVDEVEVLDWGQIGELRDAGVEIGAHTVTHPNLLRMNGSQARGELVDSRARMEDRLNVAIDSFAYPYGIPRRHFSDQTMELVNDAGFKRAGVILFRDIHPADSPLAIPRVAVTRDPIGMLRAKVIGNLDVVGMWQEHAPRWAARLVSRRTTQWT